MIIVDAALSRYEHANDPDNFEGSVGSWLLEDDFEDPEKRKVSILFDSVERELIRTGLSCHDHINRDARVAPLLPNSTKIAITHGIGEDKQLSMDTGNPFDSLALTAAAWTTRNSGLVILSIFDIPFKSRAKQPISGETLVRVAAAYEDRIGQLARVVDEIIDYGVLPPANVLQG